MAIFFDNLKEMAAPWWIGVLSRKKKVLAENSQLILIHKFCRSSFPEQARVKERKREKNAPRIANEVKSVSLGLFLFSSSDPIYTWDPLTPFSVTLQVKGSGSCKDGLHVWDRSRLWNRESVTCPGLYAFSRVLSLTWHAD